MTLSGNKQACIAETPCPVRIIFTTDVHGHFFPYDFIKTEPADGSLASVSTYLKSARERYGADNVITLDNGDILQGQPSVYYYNFIDTASGHIVPKILNLMGYDAIGVGNHDIETGTDVLDRVYSQLTIPVISANILHDSNGFPKYKPYTIFCKGGKKIAVLSLITEAIPAWLPKNLWKGLQFAPMFDSAKKYVKLIKDTERPDILIGLFHSGIDSDKKVAGYDENVSMKIAREIDGFDAILYGHDHMETCDTIVNDFGHKVWMLNPANSAMKIGVLTIDENKNVSGELVDISSLQPDPIFISKLNRENDEISKFVGDTIAEIDRTIKISDSYFGPSAFMTLLHKLQLDISGAQISFAAPLSFDGVINAGTMTISDMFTLYKYENMLCTMNLSGAEVKGYLEKAYDLWIQTVTDTQPHIIKFKDKSPTPASNRLENPSYNFDSAAGINYTVDITKPYGERIKILSLTDDTAFDPTAIYTVAVNSYRANGGGSLLTEGAGLPASDLQNRIINSTDRDLRFYMIELLKREKHVKAECYTNWHFIPTDVVKNAIITDKEILFGVDASKIQK